MLERFKENYERLSSPNDRPLLALSGGKDSMALFHLLKEAGIPFAAAHVNFGLRGNESDEDERFVKTTCSSHQVTFFSNRFDTLTYANENGYSIQEAARVLRYKWFNELCQTHGYQLILTAHHLDDSIETFFINLIRKSGPKGLAGIREKNGNIVRPLLNLTSDEIAAYIQKHNIEFRADSSNESDDYLRNRIRHHLIPPLRDDAFHMDMRSILNDFRQIDSFFEEKAKGWLNKNTKEKTILPLTSIKKEEDPEHLLSFLLHHLGITIRGDEAAKILQAPTGKVFFTAGHRLLVDRENLLLLPKGEELITECLIPQLPFCWKGGGVAFEFDFCADLSPVSDGKKMKVDGEKLVFPLLVRPWQDGDRFQPLGMSGSKKVSDFLTDEKVNRFVKDKVCVLLSDKDIVCILGHRIDHRFRITSSTKKTLTISQE